MTTLYFPERVTLEQRDLKDNKQLAGKAKNAFQKEDPGRNWQI